MSETHPNIIPGPLPTNASFRNITGQRFTRLTVVRFLGMRPKRDPRSREAMWLCLCDCGGNKITSTGKLNAKAVQSCGCFQRDSPRKLFTTHGLRDTPEYESYAHAKGRCRNPKDAAYASYGGRGIQFRFNSFEEFLDTLGTRPAPEYSLDRIDVNGHYEPGNVRWATRQTQSRNRRDRQPVTVDGQTMMIVDWATTSGIPAINIWQRINKYGWCAKCAISLPTEYSRKKGCLHSLK